MNIYTKLFIKEYVKYPYCEVGHKFWYLNLSLKKYWYYHRNFDLVSLITVSQTKKYRQYYFRYKTMHRLIGPAYIRNNINQKLYYINDVLVRAEIF